MNLLTDELRIKDLLEMYFEFGKRFRTFAELRTKTQAKIRNTLTVKIRRRFKKNLEYIDNILYYNVMIVPSLYREIFDIDITK